jgi:hypothetical protein
MADSDAIPFMPGHHAVRKSHKHGLEVLTKPKLGIIIVRRAITISRMEAELMQDNGGATDSKKTRKGYVRSEYLFPLYDLGVALQLARRVESDGGGTLAEETLAIALGLSAKSSSFRLRGLTARQFGLLSKSGTNVATTALGKAILKPTTPQEKASALGKAFVNIPLFKAVADRFKGVPLPEGTPLRNVLEREFKVESDRVQSAERVLMDSAREAGVLHTSGSQTYLTLAGIPAGQADIRHDVSPPGAGVPSFPGESSGGEEAPSRQGMLNISEEDLADFGDEEFEKVWDALGMIVRGRGKRQRMKETEENPKEGT